MISVDNLSISYDWIIYMLTDQSVITLSLITFLFIYLQILFSAHTYIKKMMNCEIFANAVKKVVVRMYQLKVTWCFDKCCSHTFHQIRSKWKDTIDGTNKNLWIFQNMMKLFLKTAFLCRYSDGCAIFNKVFFIFKITRTNESQMLNDIIIRRKRKCTSNR